MSLSRVKRTPSSRPIARDALARVREVPSEQTDADVHGALYPKLGVRKTSRRRSTTPSGLELGRLEAAIREADLPSGRRAQLLSYVRELADWYESARASGAPSRS